MPRSRSMPMICRSTRHRVRDRLPELAREDAAALALARDRHDAAVQRRADDLGAQRIPLVVGPPEIEQRAHVGGELAQLVLALVRDHLAEADEVHLLLDLLLVDQAERLPVGRSSCLVSTRGAGLAPSRAAFPGTPGTSRGCGAAPAGSRRAGRVR
jgi:hypothetical protein